MGFQKLVWPQIRRFRLPWWDQNLLYLFDTIIEGQSIEDELNITITKRRWSFLNLSEGFDLVLNLNVYSVCSVISTPIS